MHKCRQQEIKIVKIKWFFLNCCNILPNHLYHYTSKKIITKHQARPRKWKSGIIITLLGHRETTVFNVQFSWSDGRFLIIIYQWPRQLIFFPFPHYLQKLRLFFFSLRTNSNISRNTVGLRKPLTGFCNEILFKIRFCLDAKAQVQ